MKTGSLLLLSILVAGTLSCSRNHEITHNDQILLSNDMIGKWEIVHYTDSSIDKTAQLSSLNIQFNSTGEFLIFNNDSVIGGDWSIVSEIGLDKLVISVMSASQPYIQLQATWYAFDKTTSTISLSNSSPSKSQVIQLQRI